jgi:hypothetical protein
LQKYPGKKIGFILGAKLAVYGSFAISQDVYYQRMLAICQKWNIPVCDLYNGGIINPFITTLKNYYYCNAGVNDGTGDGTHYNDIGYQFISNKIETWMKTL